MEQLTKNQAVATSQEAVQNQNEPQLRDENAHNDKSVHGVLNPTYQAGLSTPDRKSGSAGMPRPTSYAVFCSKKIRRTAMPLPDFFARSVLTIILAGFLTPAHAETPDSE